MQGRLYTDKAAAVIQAGAQGGAPAADATPSGATQQSSAPGAPTNSPGIPSQDVGDPGALRTEPRAPAGGPADGVVQPGGPGQGPRDPEQLRAELRALVGGCVEGAVDDDAPLAAQGLDSLAMLELRRRIEARTRTCSAGGSLTSLEHACRSEHHGHAAWVD